MPHAPSIVHLIVAADYGESLRSLPHNEAAWVVDTPTNHAVIEHIWASYSREEYCGYPTGITSFQVVAHKTPEDWVIGVLGDIEQHHDEYSQTPPYSVLRVVGTSLSPQLRAELEECGFVRYEDLPYGFVAYKLAA